MNGTNCQMIVLMLVVWICLKIELIFDKGRLHINEKIVGLSINQWLPCPFAIWNLLFGMANLLNLVLLKHIQK